MTKVVFHLGDKKTGSTAIQTTLAGKAWSCASVSLLYPVGTFVSHIGLAKSLYFKAATTAQVARRFNPIAEAIRAQKPDVAVISAEDFEDVTPAALKAAVLEYLPEYAEGARYIAYVRPHVERLTSSFAERVKASGFVGSLDDLLVRFRGNGMLNYMPRFTAWRDSFGAAFELRPMVRELLYKNDVVQDFLRFALGTEDFTVDKTPNANESVSLENLAILRLMQAALRPDTGKRGDLEPAFCRYVAREMNKASHIKGTKIQYHRSLATQMGIDCAADAQAMDAAFFTGTPMMDALKAAPGKAVDQPQSLRIEDHYSAREQFLIRLWVAQTGTFVKQDPEGWARMLRVEQRNAVMDGMGLHDAEDTDDDLPKAEIAARPAKRAGKAGVKEGAGGPRKGLGKAGGNAAPRGGQRPGGRGKGRRAAETASE